MIDPSPDRWAQMYEASPLVHSAYHFANIANSQFTLEYLTTVLRLCPVGGTTLETGVGTGHGAIWLSLRGIHAEGIDYNPAIVERARQTNNLLHGYASFQTKDLFEIYPAIKPQNAQRYNVIHHQGVLEHFTVPQIHAALAQQVAVADWVVFSVPSVYYPFEPEFGDERLMTLADWKTILAPFDVDDLRYYGDTQHGEHEHVIGVIRGVTKITDNLRTMMHVLLEPYPDGISAIVHTRNEVLRIRDCLNSLLGVADEMIVCDMESSDDTTQISRELGAKVISHPLIPNFDRARNVSAMHAKYKWVLYLDADERIPSGFGPELKKLIAEHGEEFSAVYLPMRHHFSGHWMQCLYPGYTAPRILKNGKFYFNSRLHSGAVVDGRTVRFPADRPELAIVHYSFDSMSHYLDKLNRYTDGESLNMYRDGQCFSWQNAVQHFVADFRSYYDFGRAYQDGPHGFIYSFLSAFYRFEQHAKLFERRDRAGQLQPVEKQVPVSVEQILEFALAEVRRKPEPGAQHITLSDDESAANTVWSGPLLSPSGYGEESRQLLLGLVAVDPSISAQVIPWGTEEAQIENADMERIDGLCKKPAKSGFIHIVHNFPYGFYRHPSAGISIGRTVFETDRLPQPWVDACRSMDYVWVASEFNRKTFAASGVEADKLRVIPQSLDPGQYRQSHGGATLRKGMEVENKFAFLSVFDWTLHKGWDVLLTAFIQEFCDKGIKNGQSPILIFKVWSSMGYDEDSIRDQATAYCIEHLGVNLAELINIRFMFDSLSTGEMQMLYRSVDCYVMPSRGEGWGRPYMEAMASGLPTIATNWSGNTQFMTKETSYLLDYKLLAIPEKAWQEVSPYRGHQWAEPSVDHLRETMRRVFEDRNEATAVGKKASEHIAENFSQKAVGKLIANELECIRAKPKQKYVAPSNGKVPKNPQTISHVRWEGAFFRWHSLAYVNREFCSKLIDSGEVDLTIIPTEPNEFAPGFDERLQVLAGRQFATLTAPADVHVRHFFPPRWEHPDEGHFVLMQPWEYGFIPKLWVEPILTQVSEVWCNSNYIKQTYLASGIPEEKLKLVPLGADTAIFNPEAPPYIFTKEAGASRVANDLADRFIFLYVGGSIHRKGIDILLDAYRKAFTSLDNVCLVIKDTGTRTVYKPDNSQARILQMIEDPAHAPIVYLDDDLPPHILAGIYTTGDCIVAPYRGEGFCLPVLEAMACGVPALVTEGGPTDDFVDNEVGWRIEAEKKPSPNNHTGPWECVGQTWTFEVSRDMLAKKLRAIAANPEIAKIKGVKAAELVEKSWTWQHSADTVLKRLEYLKKIPKPKLILTGHGSNTNQSIKSSANVHLAQTSGSKTTHGKSSSPKVVQIRALQTISVCMIVRDEERVLGDCLRSLKPWVDEVIVVDTGSTDRTVEIAKEHGANVQFFPWCDDFSAARNISLSHATSDWVMWVDADDTLPEDCGKKLRNLVIRAEERTTGFIMQVHIPPAPGEFGFTIVDHVKLFRNLPQLRFEGRIHEQILESIYRAGGRVERSDLFVVHSGYDYSPEGQQKKRQRDLTHLEKDLAERPGHPFVLFNIGMTAYHLKDFAKARAVLEECLAVTKPHESTVRKLYAMLAGTYLELGDKDKARQTVEKGLSLHPRDPELLFRAGIIFREAGDLQSAERSYVTLLTAREQGHIDSIDASMTTYKAHHNLAVLYMDMGMLQEAEIHFHAAIQHYNGFTPSWHGLGELLIGSGRIDHARIVVEKLAEFDVEAALILSARIRQG